MRRRQAILIAVLAAPAPAIAFDIVDTTFEVYRTVDGEQVSETTTVVPLVMDEDVCWQWYIQTSQTGEVVYTERLVMPVAPDSWGDVDDIPEDQIGPLVLEDGGRIGISTRRATPQEGWFGRGWCLVPGDPVGPHRVDISIDGSVVKTFRFDVVAPPAKPPQGEPAEPQTGPGLDRPRGPGYDRSERTGRFSL